MRQNRNCSLMWASPRDLQAFLFSLPPSAATRNAARSALLAIFEFFIEQGVTDVNPASGLPRLPVPRSLPKALSPEQSLRVLRAASLFSSPSKEFFYLLLYTGMRRNEARLLEWRHLEDGWVRFEGKGRKERSIPLHPEVLRALHLWRKDCPSARWVFPSVLNPEKPASTTWIRDRVLELGETSGIPTLHPHQLRHTVATKLLEDGVDLRTLQEFLGHSSLASTMIYTRVRPARVAEAVSHLDYRSSAADKPEHLFGPPGPSEGL